MVKPVEQWLEGAAQIGEIHHPPRSVAHVAAHMDLDTKGVSMHAGTLVTLGDVRQPVGCLDLEYAKDFHGRIVPPGACPRNRRSPEAAGLSRSRI